jgi:hypothetical protein
LPTKIQNFVKNLGIGFYIRNNSPFLNKMHH